MSHHTTNKNLDCSHGPKGEKNNKFQVLPSKWPKFMAYTPPKINIEPENDGLKDDFPFPGWYSQVPC